MIAATASSAATGDLLLWGAAGCGGGGCIAGTVGFVAGSVRGALLTGAACGGGATRGGATIAGCGGGATLAGATLAGGGGAATLVGAAVAGNGAADGAGDGRGMGIVAS